MELKIYNLIKSYNNNIVLNIPQLTIKSGEITGLVGNNGAGKTTLLRLLLDLIKANQGYILNNNTNVSKDDKWKEYTGSFIDGRFLIDFYTPKEYFLFIGAIYNLTPKIIYERLNEFNSFTNNEIFDTHKYLRNFSEGNRQKIGIIGALLINPQVLILDEPFNHLDPTSQIMLSEIIQQVNKKYNSTIIISSHNLNFISDISSRILILEKGCVTKDMNGHNNNTLNELNNYFNKIEK